MRVKFITFGCSRNKADTELMKGLCSHEIVEEGQDVTVVNTCFVKGTTEKKILKLLHSLKGKVVVAGCLAQARPELINAYPQYSFLGVRALERINDAIEDQVVDLGRGDPDFCKERVLFNSLIGIVPISHGCLGSCSYCCTRQARGTLRSIPINSILTQIKNDLKKGVKELWLTGQDTGCYGTDINTSLPELINKIMSLKGDFRLRVGMMNPEHALKILPELIEAMNLPKVYKFLHLPLQSGSDQVLKDMNRRYTVKDFMKLVRAFPGFNIATDVICGYPTETEDDWSQTIELIKSFKPGVVNISRFFSRPGTIAARLKQQSFIVSKERSREMTQLSQEISLERNKEWIGRECEVLVTEPSRGHNEYYKPVNVNAELGSIVKAKITNAGVYHLDS